MHNRVSTALAAVALVVSLTSAGAFAATQINGASIKNHTVGVAKLTPQAVKQLKGAKGDDGARGATGAPGAMGLPGAAGTPGAAGLPGGFNPAKVTYVTGPTITLGVYPDPSYTQTASATCPAGSKVIGGGFFASINQPGASEPNISGATWDVILQNQSPIATSGWAYAVCAAA